MSKKRKEKKCQNKQTKTEYDGKLHPEQQQMSEQDKLFPRTIIINIMDWNYLVLLLGRPLRRCWMLQLV